MKKGWIIIILLLIMSAQFLVFSSFHEVDTAGYTTNASVITIAKWNYINARMEVEISPGINALNFSVVPITLILPNGTDIVVNDRSFSFGISLQRSGDFLGSSTINGPINLSQSQPMDVLIMRNVTNVAAYEQTLEGAYGGGYVQLYFLVIYGDASINVDGYGVAL